jgi:hypothetical protein
VGLAEAAIFAVTGVTVASTDVLGGGSPSADQAGTLKVVLSDLPRPDPDMAYQLRKLTDGEPPLRAPRYRSRDPTPGR